MANTKVKAKKASYNPKKTWKYDLRKNWGLYLIFLIPAVYWLIFNYAPMFGILMAFIGGPFFIYLILKNKGGGLD